MKRVSTHTLFTIGTLCVGLLIGGATFGEGQQSQDNKSQDQSKQKDEKSSGKKESGKKESAGLLYASNIIGQTVRNREGQRIGTVERSEERRVGKEGGCEWVRDQ